MNKGISRSLFVSAAALFGLAACTTFTGSTDNPVERSLTWFSYVGGQDIRAACTPGTGDSLRFVYNAVYERQIRTYDLQSGPDGVRYVARARNKPGSFANFQFSNPLGPWELRRSETVLKQDQADEIMDALARDAAQAPPSAGQRLRSNEYYWAVAACRDGAFRLLAFDQDKVDLKSLAFRGPLLAFDETKVDFLDVERVEGFADNAFEIRINAAGDGITGGL